MPCVAADGSLTDSGRRILSALTPPAGAVDVARTTGVALYRVRAALRELTAAGLAVERGGRFAATESGAARVRADAQPAAAPSGQSRRAHSAT